MVTLYFKWLKSLKFKPSARKLMWKDGDVHLKVKSLRHELDVVQMALDKDPESRELIEDESILLNVYNKAALDEELLLQQTTKICSLKEGDGKTGFFHNVVKGHQTDVELL